LATRLEAENSILYALDEPSAAWAGTTELHNMVEAAHRAAWNLIYAKWEDFRVSTKDFTIASGSTSWTLLVDSAPASGQLLRTDFFKLRMLMRKSADSVYRAMESFTLEESGDRGDIALNTGVGYMFLGDVIYVEPTEMAAGDYRAWYIPSPATLSGDSSVVQDPLNGAVLQYVIDVVCKRLRAKDDLSPGAFEKFAAELEEAIALAAQSRDARPRKVPDVRARMPRVYRTGRWGSW